MTTYYVSTTGSNNGTGTQASPWQTINHAQQASLKPGDTIMVEPGTYNEAITISQSGSAAGNITLESQVPGAALIRPPAGSYNAVTINANYVTIDGFDVAGASTGSGIFGMGVHHVNVLNNVVHDNALNGIGFVQSEFETITGNTTYKNASAGWDSGISVYENRNITGDTTTQGYRTIIANNVSYDNVTKTGTHSDGNGIIIDDFQNTQNSGSSNYTYPTLVQNNLVYGNGGKGIQVFYSDNVTVANNTAYHNNQDTLNTGTWRGEISNSMGNNNTYVNNIAAADPTVNPNNTAIDNTGANKNIVYADNITYNGTSGQASVNNDGGNSVPTAANGNMLGVDPKFVQAGTDFHLQSSSPAVNAGASGYGLATSGAVNIGAEGVSGTTSTTVSSGGGGATSAPVGSGTTTAPVSSTATSAPASSATSAPTGSGTTSVPTGSGATSASTGSGTTSAPAAGGTTSVPAGSGTTSAGSGATSTSDGNSGIHHGTHTWHHAQAVFHDAITKSTGGVYSGNSTSVNDWNATKTALQNALTTQGVTSGTLQNAEKVMNLLNGGDHKLNPSPDRQGSVANSEYCQSRRKPGVSAYWG